MNENRRFPNLFWPVLLIGIGALLFLSNLEMIQPIDVRILWRLWPVFWSSWASICYLAAATACW